MIELLLTADEVKALSAALNIAVKSLGICAESVHALNIHKKLEAAIAVSNERAAEQLAERPN